MRIHATAVAFRRAGCWRGALLRGASGAGKSDLALRLIARGWRLVSDDYTHLWVSGGRLWGEAPEAIAGGIEARGVGILAEPPLALARIELLADCHPAPLERLPEPRRESLLGIDVPMVTITALEASAPAKLEAVLARRRVALGPGSALAY